MTQYAGQKFRSTNGNKSKCLKSYALDRAVSNLRCFRTDADKDAGSQTRGNEYVTKYTGQ